MNECYLNNRRCFAFNIWNCDSAKSVIDAARACNKDVILQTSSRIFEATDAVTMKTWLTRYTSTCEISVFLHLDHCRDINLLKRAVDSGWDSVMLDASHMSIKDNILLTNEASMYAHARGVFLEAEIGQIMGTEDDISVWEEGTASFYDIERFINEAEIDMIACAIGTAHGSYTSEPRINHKLISQVANISDIPFVVHGASGLLDAEVIRLLQHPNVRKINVSTDLKEAFRTGIGRVVSGRFLYEHKTDPTQILATIYDSVQEVAEKKMKLFDVSE